MGLLSDAVVEQRGPELGQSVERGSLSSAVVGTLSSPPPEQHSAKNSEKEAFLDRYDFPDLLPRNLAGDLVRTGMATMATVGQFLVDLVPYSRWITDWDKSAEDFNALTKVYGEERGRQLQVRTLLYDALGAAAWVLPPAVGNIWKGSTKLLGKQVEKIGANRAAQRLARYEKPLEDIIKWPQADYWKGLDRTLRGKGFALAPDEAKAVRGFLEGDEHALTRLTFKKDGATEGLAKIVQTGKTTGLQTGRMRIELKPEVMEKLTPKAIRRQTILEEYASEVYKAVGVQGKERGKDMLLEGRSLYERAFPIVMEKVYGVEKAVGKSLGEASDLELATLRNAMQGHEGPALIKSINNAGPLAYFRRVSSVSGRLEHIYQTKSLGTDIVAAGMENAGMHRLQKLQLLDGMLTQAGFLKQVKRTVGKGMKFVATERLTPAVKKRTMEVFQTMAKLEREIKIENVAAVRKELGFKLKQRMQELLPMKTAEDLAVRDMVDLLTRFSDNMYAEQAYSRLWRILERREVNALGQARIEKLMNELGPELKHAFSTEGRLSFLEKQKTLDGILKRVRDTVEKEGVHWYTLPPGKYGANDARFWQRLYTSLKPGDKGGFPTYQMNPFHNYGGSWKSHVMNTLTRGGSKKDAATFYAKMERVGNRNSGDLEKEIIKRISQHSQQEHLYPAMLKAAKTLGNTPPNVVNYFEHYYARALHMPSRTDAWVAGVVERSVGAAMRAAGNTQLAKKFPGMNWQGTYSGYDVTNASRYISDLTYMAFLGFKPFSVMRNYIQPLMMVPTDLGGIKDIGTLGRAFKQVITNKEMRAELRSMGVIPEEFSGEFAAQSFKVLRETPHLGKMPLPSWDGLRDAALWMFGESHKHNCYWSGAAALVKWNDALTQVGTKRLGLFLKKSGAAGRDRATRAEIETLLRMGRDQEAKTAFVRSVVTDTQFVYGSAETPLVTQSAGAVGKQLFIFQTWWMNYGDTLAKWFANGTASERTVRAANLAMSHALAYTAMRSIWDEGISKATVGFGPFESINYLRDGPPIMQPVMQAMRTMMAIGGLAETNRPYTDEVRRQMSAMAWQTLTFMPGGLQLKQSVQRTSKEGAQGFLKSLVRYKKDTERFQP